MVLYLYEIGADKHYNKAEYDNKGAWYTGQYYPAEVDKPDVAHKQIGREKYTYP